MAADTSAWENASVHRWSRKLLRGKDGTLYGIFGACSEGQAFLRWVEEGRNGVSPMPRDTGDDVGSFGVLIVPACGVIDLIVMPYGPERFAEPYYAAGGGAEVAWGALFMGASAEQAVEAAIEHSNAARGDVIAIRHEV